MNRIRFTALSLLAAMALAFAAPAAARGDHHSYRGPRVSFGFVFGPPAVYYYPRPRYYYPAPVVVAPASPPVYIEQGQAAPEAPMTESSAWWYYCADSAAYYPYVKSCAGPWQRVAPQPPG